MICTSEEAKQKICCMMTKKCTGEDCMAWKIHYVSGEQQKFNGFPPPPPKPVKTNMGYCGHIKY